MTTPTPRSNREWRELAEQAQRDLAAARERIAKLEAERDKLKAMVEERPDWTE